jgi:putative membrane protein
MSLARALAPCAFLAVLAHMGGALAHGAGAETASDPGWQIAVAVPLFVAGGLYGCGLHRAWRRAGPGRGVRRGEALAFGAGLLVLAAMLAFPLHALGRLHFAPHMLEHGLLTLVAAPLLAAGRPGVPYLLGLPWSWRARVGRLLANERVRRFWRRLVHPGVAWTLHGGALWLWHAPALFEAALQSEAVHYLQHLTLLATALLFWVSLLPRRADPRSRIVAVFSLFTTSIHATLLSALLTLSPTIWYASYADAEGPPGLSALEDQQLAGLIMWVPFGVVYLAAALALLAAVLREDRPPRRPRGLLATAGQ